MTTGEDGKGAAAVIKGDKLTFSYGGLKVLQDFTFTLDQEGVTVLLGPSGSGKTTLLHLIAGLRQVQEGEISNPYRDRQSYLFQKPRLLPWKTVIENVAFALPSGRDRQEREEKTRKVLELVGLESFGHLYPRELSGGMEQRAAIARSFAGEADLLLMDEPFTGLDLKMKMPLLELIRRILQERRTRTVLVTHDVREAILLGDRIILLKGPPLAVEENFTNPLPPEERSMKNRAFYDLEHRLYSLILS